MIFSNNYIETKELRKNGIRCGNNCKIHETALVLNPKNLILGNNIRIDARCNLINKNKIYIGNYVTIGPNCLMNTSNKIIKIKKYTHFSDNVRIYCTSELHRNTLIAGPYQQSKKTKKRSSNILISEYCMLASNTIVLPYGKFNKGSSVGTSSIVHKELKSWTIYYGNPLSEVGKRAIKAKSSSKKTSNGKKK